ncbi:MAG: methylated-DNA--[protein]-cysteine S-methyltransferase [Acidobacteria bacterium]|nr:methylated-DNA--[protein]-cysteine S-methyltransferase [Acidobacteriota bacterium]
MLNEDRLWQAVEARDPHWDGMFVYAVPSTRIYCRPTCPSRRPRRAGVRFFADRSAAEAAGFRACRRCRPAATDGSLPAHLERVRRACTLLTGRAQSRMPLATLARAVRSSPHHLQRLFKQTLGVSPRDYADACRVGSLKSHLQSGERVADATYEAGFGSGSRVYERSSSTLGMTPAAYAAGGKGASVRYVIGDSLQRIPRGSTRSYREVASRLGRPTAARAVARACASNPVALIVPCHRVVQHDGGLGGYHWGVERKRALLKVEGSG